MVQDSPLFFILLLAFIYTLQQISARFSGNAVKIQNPRLWFTSQDSQTLVMHAWKDNFVLEERLFALYELYTSGENKFKVLKGPFDLVK